MENLLREVAKSTAKQIIEDALREAGGSATVKVFYLAGPATYVATVEADGKERRLEFTEEELLDRGHLGREKAKALARAIFNRDPA
jgi:hypothetical protein